MSAALLSLTSCIVGVGDWERFNKDFHFSYPLKADGKLSVETFNGSIDISGWDENTVDVSGTKFGPSQEEADNLKVDIDHAPDSVSIHVTRPTERRNNQGTRMTIKIPRTARLDRIVTSNGSIAIEDGAGPLHARTSNGPIRVNSLRGNLEAETSNGPIEVRHVDGDVHARTSNGRIKAEGVEGSLDVHTSNNGVNVEVARPDKDVRIETSNSGVELDLPAKFASGAHVQTNNGPITLRMAEGANVRISARTSNASIDTEFEVRAQGELSRNRLEGMIGSGGPLIDLTTSNGGIRLLKR
jgi:DUF4097 and DUF4098 domain-containing protein YvlB